MSLPTRLLRGDERRRSRLHDQKGNRAPASELIGVPIHVVLWIARRTIGWRPAIPWLSMPVIRELRRVAISDAVVVEFGSGMSTLWLARRVGSLTSFESDPDWYEMIRLRLPKRVRYELRSKNTFADLSDFPDGCLDLVIVDGINRADCVLAALPKMRTGGTLLLDDTDRHMTRPGGDLRVAESRLLQAIEERGGSYRYFVGFPTGMLVPTQSLMARLGQWSRGHQRQDPNAPAPHRFVSPTAGSSI
jgi:Methyltransferase domain